MIDYQQEMREFPIIMLAIQSKSIEFLKFIWENTFRRPDEERDEGYSKTRLMLQQSMKFSSLGEYGTKRSIFIHQIQKASTGNFNKGAPLFFIGKDLVPRLKNKDDKIFLNRIINEWKYIEYDEELLNNLFENLCFDEISTLIWKKRLPWNFTKEHFKLAIEHDQFELILHFIRLRDCRSVLNEKPYQKKIVDQYMKFGNKMFYGAEMLVYIYQSQWDYGLTKDLCKNILKTIKTKDILNCHSPILTCLLLSEFLNAIGEISIQDSGRCEKVVTELQQFCRNIQEANPDEGYIKFLMTQKDSRGRSAFQIASENSFYPVLETAEVGTIVKKMWNGNLSNNGFFAASSMHRYLDSEVKTMDPFASFDSDTTKLYFYQLAVWTDSCSLRYWPESISTVILIIVYNLYIYFLVLRGQMMNDYTEIDTLLQFLLFTYIAWVFSIALGVCNMILYGYKARRKFKFNIWTWMELAMLILAFCLLIDTKQVFGEYSVQDVFHSLTNIIDTVDLPFSKYLSIQASNYSGSFAFLARAILLAINDILVWLRIIGILLTFKEIGPMIRMINLMTVLLLKYILIIVLFLACCAAIFTSLFFNYSDQFKDFSTSVMTLFGGFVGNFNPNGFQNPNYKLFGSIMVIAYICIAGVLLINLIIALLSNVYEKLSLLVDASHRAVLVTLYKKYKWDDNYGYMIFLTTPLNVINFITLPFAVCCGKKSKRNLTKTCVKYTTQFFTFLLFLLSTYFIHFV